MSFHTQHVLEKTAKERSTSDFYDDFYPKDIFTYEKDSSLL